MNHNKIHLVSESILEGIEKLRNEIINIPEYYLSNAMEKFRKLKAEALHRSCSLELEIYNTKTPSGRRKKRKELRKNLKNISNAFEWGLMNYKGELTHEFIKTLGYLIEPEIYTRCDVNNYYNNKPSYRKVRVKVTGATWSPPGPEKVEREMDKFLEENRKLENIVDKALHAHFHIARIHPFEDGNGRTARLVQNIILEKNNYYPIIIHEREKEIYCEFLDNAINAYTINKATTTDENKFIITPEENKFYDFLAMKLFNTYKEEVDKIERKIRTKNKIQKK